MRIYWVEANQYKVLAYWKYSFYYISRISASRIYNCQFSIGNFCLSNCHSFFKGDCLNCSLFSEYLPIEAINAIVKNSDTILGKDVSEVTINPFFQGGNVTHFLVFQHHLDLTQLFSCARGLNSGSELNLPPKSGFNPLNGLPRLGDNFLRGRVLENQFPVGL